MWVSLLEAVTQSLPCRRRLFSVRTFGMNTQRCAIKQSFLESYVTKRPRMRHSAISARNMSPLRRLVQAAHTQGLYFTTGTRSTASVFASFTPAQMSFFFFLLLPSWTPNAFVPICEPMGVLLLKWVVGRDVDILRQEKAITITQLKSGLG